MLKYTVAIAINASPEVVFEVLTDAPSWPEWNATVDSLEGTIALGEEVTLTTSFNLDEPMTFDLSVDALTPNEAMTWSSGNFIFKGVRTFTVTDNGDGTSTFTMEENFSGLFAKSIAKTFDLQPSFDQMASDVKAEAEAEAEASVPVPEPEPEEVDVPLEQLPEAVLSAVKERWPDAELREAELEGETYDVVFQTKEGELLEVEVSADGTLGEVEVEDGDDEEPDASGEEE